MRTGRTVRSSVDRGFTRSFRTILAADLVSLIGAGVLYVLAIGLGAGLRVLPRPLDDPRPARRLLLHAPARVAHGAAPARSCACGGVGIAAGLDAPEVDGVSDDRGSRRGAGTGTAAHARRDLYHERTNFDFIDRSWRWALLSGTLIVISLVAFVDQRASTSASTSRAARSGSSPSSGRSASRRRRARRARRPLGLGDAKVLILGERRRPGAGRGAQAERERATVTDGAREVRGASTRADVSVTDVGPDLGRSGEQQGARRRSSCSSS